MRERLARKLFWTTAQARFEEFVTDADFSNPKNERVKWAIEDTYELVDEILDELRTPDEGMTAVGVKRYQDEGDGYTDTHCLTAAFTAMIDAVKAGK
jgi:hypothetical protein